MAEQAARDALVERRDGVVAEGQQREAQAARDDCVEVAGALAYRLLPDALHVVALATDPMWQRSGVATHLITEAEVLARRHGLRRMVFATTNDNLPALYFYQRRGWTITEVVPGAMIPHVRTPEGAGFAGIPVRDEIRLQKELAD